MVTSKINQIFGEFNGISADENEEKQFKMSVYLETYRMNAYNR